jgi:hypothetical protein
MRRFCGFDQPAVIDASVWPFMRITTAALSLPVLERVLAALAPEAYAVVHDALAGRPPLRDEVVSPAEARRRVPQGAHRHRRLVGGSVRE